jgi:hypothetical protein
MRVNRAKRRLLRWQRYVAKTGSKPNNHRLGGSHLGIVLAHSDVMYARRWAPIGVREPWLPLWASGWKSGT